MTSLSVDSPHLLAVKPDFTIIIPTLNEAENVQPLLDRVLRAVGLSGLSGEILVVDGGSTDSTGVLVRQYEPTERVRWIQSNARRGLAGDILRGAEEAESDVVLVMDADLSHPPEAIESLVRPIIDGSKDMVIGSRYVENGSTPGWPWIRRLASKTATCLAWPLVSVRDPMSGFFAVRKELMLELGGEAAGFKIGLEILARGEDQLRTLEQPIAFVDRERGQSKLGLRETMNYLNQLVALAGGTASAGHATRFAAVGAVGLVVDFVLFNLLLLLGLGMVVGHVTSFIVATLVNYSLNCRWAFAQSAHADTKPVWHSYLRFLFICVLALFLRGAILASLVQDFHWKPQMAILIGVVGAAVVNFIGTAFFVFPKLGARATPSIRWRVLAICVAVYMLVLRWFFAGIVELMPQESYYWVYSQHLDYGYLDHPPMVAWLVWAGTWLLGKEEAAVRLPAVVCWMITAFFIFRLTANQYGKTAAFRAVMLLSVLPIYTVVGIMMTPDAPLFAAWAGSLYFLDRALVARQSKAWLGLGVCLGFGMLSKYTIALLGPATMLFVLLHRPSRIWLKRPQPYLAALLALGLFTPVILWNANHGWASFNFQGSRRWSGSSGFSLHELIGSIVLLLTPLGLLGIVTALAKNLTSENSDNDSELSRRQVAQRLFARVFTLTPLSVFVLQSLNNDSQLNWTGPIWLAAIPVVASCMVPDKDRLRSWSSWLGEHLWRPSIAALILFYGTSLYYIHLGFPGLPAQSGMPFPIAWKALANQIEDISDKVGDQTIVTGVDRYKISSAFAFYDPDNDGLEHTSGSHLFGEESVMWKFWEPEFEAEGKKVMMVSFDPDKLLTEDLTRHFAKTSPIVQQPIERDGQVVGHFYYRIGYDYQVDPRADDATPTLGRQASTGIMKFLMDLFHQTLGRSDLRHGLVKNGTPNHLTNHNS